jgi:excinuclease ABC subunit C
MLRYSVGMMKLDKAALPATPGIYFFKNRRGTVLYVGKAANLRSRISSYFQKGSNLSPAKQRLINEAATLSWKETGSEIEALLAEARYIKMYQPRFNVLLRDDKTFLSVVITHEEFPRVLTTRNIDGSGTYFGPFTDARAVKETLRVLRHLFPYRTGCKPNSGRACLDMHLGLCPGVCVGAVSAAEYKKTIRRIKLFLEGKKGRVISTLKKELKTARRKHNEISIRRASRLREQIQYLEKYLTMSHVLAFGEKSEGDVIELGRVLGLSKPPHRIEGYDVSNIMGMLATASMVVFSDGRSDKNEYRKFKIKTVRGANDVAMLKEVFRRRFQHLPSQNYLHLCDPMGSDRCKPHKYKKDTWPVPDLVIVDGGRPQLGAALAVWREMNLAIPLVSLAKRLEEVFIPGQLNPLVLPRTSPALHLLQRIRDEAHRFAVSYHKLLRRKKLLKK